MSKNEDRTDYVYENKGKQTKCHAKIQLFLQEYAPNSEEIGAKPTCFLQENERETSNRSGHVEPAGRAWKNWAGQSLPDEESKPKIYVSMSRANWNHPSPIADHKSLDRPISGCFLTLAGGCVKITPEKPHE